MRMARHSYWISALVIACVVATSVWLARKRLASTQGPIEKVTIASLSLPGAGLFFVSEDKGFFREQGLDVHLQNFLVGKLALESLFRGEAAFAIAGDTPLVFSVLGGRNLELLSTVYQPNGGISILAHKDRVPSPGDLRGKRLGVTFISSGQFVADSYLVMHGIPQAEVTMLDLPQREMVEGLLMGNLDAACLWQPNLAEAQAKLGDKGITFPDDGLRAFRLSLVANHGYAAQHPRQVYKLLTALKQAESYITENPTESLRIMGRATDIPEATFKRFFDPADYRIGLEQGLLLAFEDQSRWAIKHGFVKADKMPNYQDIIQPNGLHGVSPESIKIVHEAPP